MSPATALGSFKAVAIRSSRLIDFDVERLPHVGAAIAQDLHDLGPVLHRIEMCLDRLRRSRDFAQCQRKRKNLD